MVCCGMDLKLGVVLIFCLAVTVSSRSVIDLAKSNSSSADDDFWTSVLAEDFESLKEMGFKEEIEKLITRHPNVVKALGEKEPLNELMEQIPPSWLLILPSKSLLKSWVEDPQKVLAKYLESLPKTDPTAIKLVSAFSSQDDGSRNTFLESLPQGGGLSNSIWSDVSEDVSRNWWPEKNASLLIGDLVKLSKDAVKFLPFDVVSRAKEVDGLGIFSDDVDWEGVPRAHICVWKNVIEKTTLILRRIYTALRPLSKNDESRGFVPLLRCFSPRDLSNWKAESNRVSNDKTPILEMIKDAQQLGLNQLQVQALADCIDWSDQSLDVRRNVFHMLDPSLIGSDDLRDYDKDYFRRFKVSWDLIVRIKKLKLEKIPKQGSNNLLRELGPLYVALPGETPPGTIGDSNLDVVNGVFSPWMRLTQARNILKTVDDGQAINSDLAYALPSTNILEWTDAKIERISNVEKMTPTQKWAMAENILSNKAFAPYYYDILEWIHPRSNLTFLDGVKNLPEALSLQVLDADWDQVSSPLSKEDINARLEQLIPGLTCAKLYNTSLLDLPIIASAYSNYAKSKVTDDLSTFSTSLRLCFKNRMVKYLKQKAMFFGYSDKWEALSVDEVKSFGGYVLSALELEEVDQIKDVNVKQGLFQELGSLSIPELMPMMSYSDLKKLASQGIENGDASFSSINKLGSLTYFLDKSFLMSLHPFDIRLFLKNTLSGDSRYKLTCLKEEDRQNWSEVISHGFAASRSWTSWSLIHFGDLLINMNPEGLMNVNPNNFRRAIAQILEQSKLHSTFSSFTKFDRPTSFLNACESWLGEEESSGFRLAFNDLMRFYLRVAEYSIKVAKRDTLNQLSPKDLRSRRALKEKLFEIYNRMKHVWSAVDSTNDKNWDYMKNLVVQITNEKEQLIKTIIQKEEKDMMNATELYKEFRSSSTKISEHLDSIEDFLIDTQRLIIREFKYLYNLTADQITPEYSEEEFCSIVECVDPDWCSLQNCFQIKYEDRPMRPTCDGLIAAGKSGTALSPKDLSLWEESEVLDCLSVLGTIPWESTEKKEEIWDAIKGSVDLKNSEQLLSLGTLLEVIELDDVEFQDDNIDAISLIGSFPRTSSSMDLITGGRIRKYLRDAENAKAILELRKVSLGHLLCSLNEDGKDSELIEILFGPLYGVDQSPVPSGEDQQRVFDFSRLSLLKHLYSCDNEAFRKEVANQVLKYYEDSLDNMTPADVSSIGLFVSGIQPDILKKLSKENFELIHPAGVKYFTPDQVSLISLEKLSRMTPEALTQFKESHVPSTYPINSKQINLLRRKELNLAAEVRSEPSAASGGGSSLNYYSFITPSTIIMHCFMMVVSYA